MSIKEARESKKMSQKQLAEALGVSQPTVCDWEAGRKSPGKKNLAALSQLLGYSADYLLFDRQQDFPPSDAEIKFALFGADDIDDELFQEVKRFALFAKKKRDERPQ